MCELLSDPKIEETFIYFKKCVERAEALCRKDQLYSP